MYRFFVNIDGKEVNVDDLPPEKKKELFIAANRRAAEATGHQIVQPQKEKTA